jgi:hypothetical protein
VRGEVLVGLGERVEPNDIIARGVRHTETHLVDVARGLGVRDDQVGDFLRKHVGEPVRAGEVIASRKGFLGLPGRACRSPRDGSIAALKRGRVVIQSVPVPVEVTADLRGKIVRLIADFGAVVETEGGLIQGVWGLGAEAAGIVKVPVKAPEEPLTTHMIDVSCQGYVLVGGSIDRAALDKAVEMKVKAIVVGGVHADLVVAGRAPLPLVATEGLGALPMSDVVFNLLQTNEGQEACVSGAMAIGGESVRPEVILFIPGTGEPARQARWRDLRVGATVRITREPHLGRLGVVRRLPAVSVSMRPASALPGVEVELRGGAVISVSVRNLELVC